MSNYTELESSNIIKGKTSIGFKYSLDMRKASDIKVISILAKMQGAEGIEGEALALEYAEIILGKPQFSALENYIRKKNDGYCPADIFGAQVNEIINGNNSLKN